MSLTFPFITGGTVSVNNGSTSVTGSGTAFLTHGVKAGDVLFILSSSAPPVPIGADASSNTALTLGIAFGGSNQSAVPYFIMRAVDAEIVLSAQREFIELYNANANLSVFAALSLVADKLPYANGAGTLALADFKAWGRSMLALTVAANKGLYFTDANTAATFDLTEAARALLAAHPGSLTDNRLIRADGTTGVLQQSPVTLGDTGDLTGLGLVTGAGYKTFNASITDDAVADFGNVTPNGFGTVFFFNADGSANFTFAIRVRTLNASPAIQAPAFGGGTSYANVATTTSNVTGTTGDDGKLTVSCTASSLKVENRLGFNISIAGLVLRSA